MDGGDDPVHGIDAVKVIGGHDQGAIGMLQWRGKSAADHIAQNVKDHDICVFEHVMLLEQFDRLAHDIAATARARRGAARLNAFDAIEPFEDKIFWAQLFWMKVDFFQDIDHRWNQRSCEGKGAVMFGITADLQHAFSQF